MLNINMYAENLKKKTSPGIGPKLVNLDTNMDKKGASGPENGP